MRSQKWISGLLAVFMAVSATACSSGGEVSSSSATASPAAVSSGSSVPASSATLRIAWWGSQTRHDDTLKVLDAYTKKTGVKFEAEYMPFDGYFTKLNTLIASNDVYDIFQVGSNFTTYLNQIEPLDSYISDGTIDTSDIAEGYLKTTTYNDKIYGISLGVNTYGFAYDPALFKKAGLSEPTENWTRADFEKDCIAIKQKLNIFGSSKIDDWVPGVSASIPQYNAKENVFTADGKALDYTEDKPVADYLALKQRLVKAGAYPNLGETSEIKDIEGDYLVTGDAAMTWVASNQFISLSKAANRPLKLATVPRITADGSMGMTVTSSQMFSMSNACKNKTDAAKFMSYFVNDIDANKILMGERGVPINAKVRTALEEKQTDAEKEVYQFVDTVGKNSEIAVILDPPQISQIKDLYTRLHNQVVTNTLDADKAAAQFRSGAEELLKKGS